MNRKLTIGALLAMLMFVLGVPAYGVNKEMVQLEEQVKLLADQMSRMQQNFDAKLAALQADAEQTSSAVKQISVWAAHVDASLKEQTLDSDTCADQISGNSKALQKQLEDVRAKLDRITKQIHDLSTTPDPNNPAGLATNPTTGNAPRPPDTPNH
jgi:methyl-accepting chemotaxis protein